MEQKVLRCCLKTDSAQVMLESNSFQIRTTYQKYQLVNSSRAKQ